MDADILIHEATNAFIPSLDAGRFQNAKHLERDTMQHGHSTPEMAAKFASNIRAKKLILTHFSARYNGDYGDQSMKLMWYIEDLARKAGNLKGPNDIIAAWDLMSIDIPIPASRGFGV
jgi:ribonuclease Z